MKAKDFFLQPGSTAQQQYEALRAFYMEGLLASEAAERFNFSPAYFKKLRYEFSRLLKKGETPFFEAKKTGPKGRFTERDIIVEIIAMRKQNHSIQDIKAVLEAKDKRISLDTIDNILKAEGFAPLPKRTHQERLSVRIPDKIEAPRSIPLEIRDEEFITEKGVAPLVFLPLME